MEHDKNYFRQKVQRSLLEYEKLSDEEKLKLAATVERMSDKIRSEIMAGYELGYEYYFFYGEDSPFSQWYKCSIVIDDISYTCTEQYMMFCKAILFKDDRTAELILKSGYQPSLHKELGRKIEGFDQNIWDANKRAIVFTGNYYKFIHSDNLSKLLLGTSPKILVEASPIDKIWGIGLSIDDERRFYKEKWEGENLLGYILTEVREEIRKKQADPSN